MATQPSLERHRRTTVPVPPVEAATAYVEAGPVRFGVEYRVLTDEVIERHTAAIPGAGEAHYAVRAERGSSVGDLDDQGTSIHVFDAASGTEHLRFDMFDEDPHYHYMQPGNGHVSLTYDSVANGPFLSWILDRLGTRLGDMLEQAGAPVLATRVGRLDPAILARSLAELRAALERAGGPPEPMAP